MGVVRRYIDILIITNTQMVAVALGPWASHSEDKNKKHFKNEQRSRDAAAKKRAN